MKKYNYILFDWDGCIAKTLDSWLDAYKQTFAEYDVYPGDRRIASDAFGNWNAPLLFGIKDVKEFSKKLIQRIDAYYPTVPLYPNAKLMIETLKTNNKRLALISSSDKNILGEALANNNLTNVFDLVVTGDEVRKHKPDPESLYRALQFFNATPNEAIMIGDSKSDLGAAKNASLDSVLFYPRHNELFYELETLKTFQPTYIIQDFKELETIIQ